MLLLGVGVVRVGGRCGVESPVSPVRRVPRGRPTAAGTRSSFETLVSTRMPNCSRGSRGRCPRGRRRSRREALRVAERRDDVGTGERAVVDDDRRPGEADRRGGRQPLAVDADRLGARPPQLVRDELEVLGEDPSLVGLVARALGAVLVDRAGASSTVTVKPGPSRGSPRRPPPGRGCGRRRGSPASCSASRSVTLDLQRRGLGRQLLDLLRRCSICVDELGARLGRGVLAAEQLVGGDAHDEADERAWRRRAAASAARWPRGLPAASRRSAAAA